MGKPAARMNDMTAHGSVLAPGPGSTNVRIGGQPAWRGMSAAAAAALAAAVAELAEKIAKAQAVATAAAERRQALPRKPMSSRPQRMEWQRSLPCSRVQAPMSMRVRC